MSKDGGAGRKRNFVNRQNWGGRGRKRIFVDRQIIIDTESRDFQRKLPLFFVSPSLYRKYISF